MKLCLAFLPVLSLFGTPLFASVSVASPTNNSVVTSPVAYTATGSTSCATGVAAMGVYVNSKLAFQQNGSSLSTSLTLNPGVYQTVVQEWDYCGGSTTTPVSITVGTGSAPVSVTNPVTAANGITVSGPVTGATVSSPVAFTASAIASGCASGVAAMGIYIGSSLKYQVNGASLSTSLPFAAGAQSAVVQEWDNCGKSATRQVNFIVGGSLGSSGITVSAPALAATVSSPVSFAATATTASCPAGVAAMGIYVGGVLRYQVNGNTLSTALPFAAGAQSAVVQEWDNCGGALTRPVTFTVGASTAPTVSLTATPAYIAAGASSTLSWTATNATSVTIDQGVGSVTATGTQSVSPTQTTTYTITATGNGTTVLSTATVTIGTAPTLTGVMEWKGNSKSFGQYNQETTLTLANVNPAQFGKVREFTLDGEVQAQPLYVRSVNMGSAGVHDLLLVATENDSVYAYDGQSTARTPLWRRNFLATGVTVQVDNHGGRSTFGGQIGITGTPVIDPATGILYVVAATQQNGVVTDTLHALDIRTGSDVNGGARIITASVPGTGEANVNGILTFMPGQQNQRPGLVLNHGVLYIAFGSFSDAAPYHGWLFAYDPASLKQLGVFISTPNYRADYDSGSGAAFWNGGAAPSFEDDGSFYVVAADGSTDVENGGQDYGDTVLHMQYSNGQFSVLDWFTPFNRDCIDRADLEMGSGGFALLPEAEVGNGRHLGVALTKEGRLYLLDRTSLGHFDANGDQSVQMFMVGDHVCNAATPASSADGPLWNRLYGNASYWNGNLYMAASNQPIKQFSISGSAINPVPVSVGSTPTYYRGGNTVVSSSANTNGIVWAYNKSSDGNGVLHAFDATNVAHELWNTTLNPIRDALSTGGAAFEVPVVIDGKVIASSGADVVVYQLLN